MASDRQTLETEVKYLLGNRDDADSLITAWVQRAYQALTQRVEFPEALASPVSVVTAISVIDYSLPSDYFSIYAIKNLTTDLKLLQESNATFLTRTSEDGSAEFYTIMGSQFRIWKTPTSTAETLEIWYRRIFPSLSDPTSVHLLKDCWDQAIVWEAAGYGFAALGEIERHISMQRAVRAFISSQTPVLVAELVDRDEAVRALS